MAQPKYDKEFKQTIVDLLSLDTPKSINEICKEYNLKKPTVYRWLKEFKRETGAFKDEHTHAYEKEIRQLKKQLKEAQMERNNLKKAVSIFSVSDK